MNAGAIVAAVLGGANKISSSGSRRPEHESPRRKTQDFPDPLQTVHFPFPSQRLQVSVDKVDDVIFLPFPLQFWQSPVPRHALHSAIVSSTRG